MIPSCVLNKFTWFCVWTTSVKWLFGKTYVHFEMSKCFNACCFAWKNKQHIQWLHNVMKRHIYLILYSNDRFNRSISSIYYANKSTRLQTQYTIFVALSTYVFCMNAINNTYQQDVILKNRRLLLCIARFTMCPMLMTYHLLQWNVMTRETTMHLF